VPAKDELSRAVEQLTNVLVQNSISPEQARRVSERIVTDLSGTLKG
jgi:hypothetical protein